MSMQEGLRQLAGQAVDPPFGFDAFEQRRERAQSRRRAAIWSAALSVSMLALVGILALVTQPQVDRHAFMAAVESRDLTAKSPNWRFADLLRHGTFRRLARTRGPLRCGRELERSLHRLAARRRVGIAAQVAGAQGPLREHALERLDHAGVPNLIRLGQAEDPRIATSTRHLLFDNQMMHAQRGVQSDAPLRFVLSASTMR